MIRTSLRDERELATSAAKRENSHESHEVWHKRFAGPFNDTQKGTKDGQAQSAHERPRLELIHDPQLAGLLVEAVPLLDDKVVVV